MFSFLRITSSWLQTLKSDESRLHSWLSHLLAMWLCKSNLTFLSLGFFFLKNCIETMQGLRHLGKIQKNPYMIGAQLTVILFFHHVSIAMLKLNLLLFILSLPWVCGYLTPGWKADTGRISSTFCHSNSLPLQGFSKTSKLLR